MKRGHCYIITYLDTVWCRRNSLSSLLSGAVHRGRGLATASVAVPQLNVNGLISNDGVR